MYLNVTPSLNLIGRISNELTTHKIQLITSSKNYKKPKTLEQKTQLITKWQPLWTNLLNILFTVDQICYKEQEAFVDEPDAGQLFYTWLLE